MKCLSKIFIRNLILLSGPRKNLPEGERFIKSINLSLSKEIFIEISYHINLLNSY
jgi:hypothetical protein